MAVRSLPNAQRGKGILWGASAAVLLFELGLSIPFVVLSRICNDFDSQPQRLPVHIQKAGGMRVSSTRSMAFSATRLQHLLVGRNATQIQQPLYQSRLITCAFNLGVVSHPSFTGFVKIHPPLWKGAPGGISDELLKNPPQSPFFKGGVFLLSGVTSSETIHERFDFIYWSAPSARPKTGFHRPA